MKKILYYITDHGLGHTTRSVAIIRELIKKEIEVTIRNSNVSYLTNSLPDVKIISGTTDVGPVIKKNGISIDERKTLEHIGKWIDSISNVSAHEYDLMLKLKPDLVVSDISAMPFLASNKAGISSVAISNFSWVDVLKGLPKHQSTLLEDAYGLADLAIQLPLGPQMKPFRDKKQVGLVCKKPTDSRKSLRDKLGLTDSNIGIFVNLNKYFELKPKVGNNVKIISTGAKIHSTSVSYIDPWIEGQDLISAVDLVISKCGYGMTSECLTNGIPFLFVSDDNHIEQKAILADLEKRGLHNRILENNLDDLVLNREFVSNIKSQINVNDTEITANLLQEMMH